MLNIHLYRSNFNNESRIFREVTAIEELNLFNQIHLVGTNDNKLPDVEKFSKFTTIYRFLKRPKKKSQLSSLLQILKWHIVVTFKYMNKEIEFINCHSVNVLPLAVFLKLITNAKLIYDTHELETETAALKGISKLIAKITERIFINSVDYCIFVSDSIKSWYLKRYKIKKATCIYNCPKYKKTRKTNYLKKKFNISHKSNIFIYQGAFVEDRGLEILLDVFRTNTKNDIVFMGYGKLKDLIKSYSNNYPNIHFHDSVHPSKVLKIAKSADFGIALVDGKYLNHQFCLPNKLFEYMFAGLHVLASDLPEINLLSNEFDCISLCKENKAELKSEITRLTNLNIKKSNNKYQELSWEHQSEKLYTVYKNLID
mgnify:CR=1 FL=1